MTILLEDARLAPPKAERWRAAAADLFSSPVNAVVTVVVAGLIAAALWRFARWAVVDAAWSGGAETCRQRSGACWPFVASNAQLMVFGVYPQDLLWRPAVSLALMAGVIAASMIPRLWSATLALAWGLVPAAVCILLSGTFFGRPVSTNEWGGLPLTLLVWMIAFAGAFVVAIPLALARRSNMGGLRTAAIIVIELVRGVPMLVALYVSRFIVPMTAPGLEINLFVSVETALILFVASYLAEIVRAGLQALPRGQTEAANALGLGYWRTTQLILLPQALRAVIPALVNLGIGVLLSTPLVAVIGMTDFLSAVREAASHEQDWPGCYTTAYFVAGLVFFSICFIASRYSRWLERRLRAAGHG
ncbi:amino acid ABC transporter membrane protein 2 (PAAT family) [Roseiarcus fermentans]|uniref:Amino acid ABC transporter membrane protein 2 (PAAT family) n=1 Tax=Roseiarcus fermentans TaxID=1473586 RepID=A0A366FSD9_9HYPH|nr:amino acid ABC transporter permease [Roseiarcus fermentans]RBP17593.1 amino acid ABC transporter membrane protein 2 (PAAT family) [Roseiarcus fermentans]